MQHGCGERGVERDRLPVRALGIGRCAERMQTAPQAMVVCRVCRRQRRGAAIAGRRLRIAIQPEQHIAHAAMRHGVFRIYLQRCRITLQCRIRPVQGDVHVAELAMNVGCARFQCQRLAIARLRRLKLLLRHQDIALATMRHGQRGIDVQRAAIAFPGFLQVPLRLQHVAQAAERLGKGWRQFQGAHEIRHGQVGMAAIHMGIAQVQMGFGVVGCQFHRLLQGWQGVLALQPQGHAQHAPGQRRHGVGVHHGACRLLHLDLLTAFIQANDVIDFLLTRLLNVARRRCCGIGSVHERRRECMPPSIVTVGSAL